MTFLKIWGLAVLVYDHLKEEKDMLFDFIVKAVAFFIGFDIINAGNTLATKISKSKYIM